ncbi:MAG TPA: GTPase HflX, partial [Pseudobdellovibrionaceae bacterium]|nr:GTPase HflX [Pseudobdellovibrionaceae bacterium]
MTSSSRLKALLVGLQLPKVSDEEVRGSLAELGRLVTTLGYEVVGETSQKRTSDRNAIVVGEGKLKELAKWTGGPGVVGPGFVKKKSKAALRFEGADAEEEDDSFEEEPDEGGPEDSEGAPGASAETVVF